MPLPPHKSAPHAAPSARGPPLPPHDHAAAPLFPGGELPAGAEDHRTRASYWRDVTQFGFIVQRWRLIAFTVPIIALFIGLRWSEWNGRFFAAPIDYSVVAPLTTSVVFVCATMLSNVVSDYKEGEKIPAELTGYFQSLLAAAVMQEAHHARRHGGAADADAGARVESGAALRHIEALLLCVIGFLDGRFHYNLAVAAFLENEMALCEELERLGRTDLEHVEQSTC